MIIDVLHVIFDNDEGVIDCLILGDEKQTPKLTVPSESHATVASSMHDGCMTVQPALQVWLAAMVSSHSSRVHTRSAVMCSLLAALAFGTVSFVYCNNDEGVIDCLISR